jgi:DNA-binding MarR family transcriptional regulator
MESTVFELQNIHIQIVVVYRIIKTSRLGGKIPNIFDMNCNLTCISHTITLTLHSFHIWVIMQNKGNCLIEEYIGKTIGLGFRYKGSANELVKSLPQYLKGAFIFSLVEIEGVEFLLLTPLTELDLSTSQIVKFANQISKQTGKPTLIQFKSMDNIRRRTLIHNKENFVVLDKQIYIPSLRMYLNEGGSIQQFAAKENLSPSAQFLLLYHLQKASLEGLPFKDVAEALNYSKKNISVVAAELQRLSICEVEQINERSKVLRFNKKGRELWDNVSPLMASPIQKIWYIEKNQLPANIPFFASFDTALAHYTFIADSSLSSFAIDKKNFSEHQEELQEFLHPEDGNVRLEVWKYNPALLVDKQFIDRLSLALCYKDADDERVRKEITEMINKITW